ncbi:MAG TPA: hypothetical protein EYN41_10695 [Flavobacteriales bacterium]|nr:hypothetical protein [Flavobacteriales bacterium]
MKELYAKFIDAPLNTLEGGGLFKKGIYYALLLVAGLTVLGGLYATFSGLFGEYGYLKQLFNASGFQIARGIVASLITIILSILTFVVMALIILKRANDLNAKPYSGLLHYLHKELFPTMIQIYGEVMAVVPIMLALTAFFSALFATYGHSALGEISGGLFAMVGMGNMIGMMTGGGMASDFGSYIQILGMSLGGILGSVLLSFVVLLGTYVMLEVYNYVVLLITNLVKFFPRFAFPLWVQKSERGGGNIDSSDL